MAVSTIELYAEGSVPEYQMKTVQSACDSYVKMHEIIEIEKRLSTLKKKHNVNKFALTKALYDI